MKETVLFQENASISPIKETLLLLLPMLSDCLTREDVISVAEELKFKGQIDHGSYFNDGSCIISWTEPI